MHKLDIDYQVLHDAFFKYQTKPKMTIHGDLYYEGREFEVRLHEKKPGVMSEDLREALGMEEGHPPPWLINMQRYGPPPSYPTLKIPGLNAPIPAGASWGHHLGGWGRPPADEFGRPLYGDVYNQNNNNQDDMIPGAPAPGEKQLWGELEESDVESSEESGSEADEGEAPAAEKPSEAEEQAGTQSVPLGFETPDMLELRKKSGVETPSEAPTPKPLFEVLDQEQIGAGKGMMGGTHKYVLPTAGGGLGAETPVEKAKPKSVGAELLKKTQDQNRVEVALNPEELENLTENVIKEKFQEKQDELSSRERVDDYSDVLAEESRKRKRKQEKADKSKKQKEYTKFKF
eukprot:Rmarinus@m.9790